MLRAIACISCSLAMSFGCASYRREPLDPSAELAALETRTPAVLVESVAQGARADFSFSDGLDEREIIAIALRLNTELAAARVAIGEADSLLLAAGTFPDPEFGASYQPGINGTDSFNADVDLMFELLRLGELGARKDAARSASGVAKAGVTAKEYEVATDVRRQLTRVLQSEQELDLLTQELTLRRRGAELVSRRRNAGEANALDVAAAELELQEIEREHRRASTSVPRERAKLNRLLGLPPGYQLHLSDSGKPIEVRLIDIPSSSALQQTMIAGRLDLREKEAEYEQAEQELRLEVIRQYPSLKLGPSFSHEGPGANFLGLAVALDVPLLNRNRGEVAAKLARRDRIRSEYIDLLHRLTAGASDAMEHLISLRREVEIQQEQTLPALERNAKLFQAALDARELNIVDFVTMQQRALEARRAYLQTLIEYRNATIELDGATGMMLSGLRAALPLPVPTTQSISKETKE